MNIHSLNHEDEFNAFAVTNCAGKVRALAKNCASLENLAQAATKLLFEKQEMRFSQGPSCALVRFFRTVDFNMLEKSTRADVTSGGASFSDTDKFLTLLGTSGMEAAWNDRRLSAGHQAIPLLSAEMIAQSPMIAQLVSELGIEISSLLDKRSPQLKFKDPIDRDYNVFYIADALNSPYIPSQTDFVQPFKIKSVVGYGSLLDDGHFYAVILFYRTFVPENTLKRFTALALSTTIAVLSVPSENIWRIDELGQQLGTT